MIRRPPRSTLFPYNDALPIYWHKSGMLLAKQNVFDDFIAAAEYLEHERWTSKQRSEEHTSELQSPDHLVCRLLLEKKKSRLRLTRTQTYLARSRTPCPRCPPP